jgi:predicted regulator of Ras-like GTPase activity (Roadblock/LC7/MglB family)
LSTNIAQQLRALRANVAGLEDATLINFDGQVVVTTQSDAKAAERVAAMSMALLTMGEQSAISLQRGELIEAYVRTANSTLVLIPLSIDALLAARVRLEVPLGLALLELRRLAEALAPQEKGIVPEAEPSPAVPPAEKSLSAREAWMIECIVRGLLHLYKVTRPPVPLEAMLERPYPAFAAAAEQREDRKPVAENARERRWNQARDLYFRIYYHEDSTEPLEKFELVGSEVEAEYFAACLLLPAEWVRLAAGRTTKVKSLARAFNVSHEKIRHRLAELGLAGPE